MQPCSIWCVVKHENSYENSSENSKIVRVSARPIQPVNVIKSGTLGKQRGPYSFFFCLTGDWPALVCC